MKEINRVVIKISGEAFSGGDGFGISDEKTEKIALQLKQIHEKGIQTAVVLGGGNFWRARQNPDIDRVTADQIGMLATVMNSLALESAMKKLGVPCAVMSAFGVEGIAGALYLSDAKLCLEHGNVVIFAGGTGSPYFTTDTTGALRAAEIGADMYLCAKHVDGVYDSDPRKNPSAKRFDRLTFDEVLKRRLGAMDLTAMTMCMENDISVLIFDCLAEDAILNAAVGKKSGTIIENA